MMAKPGWRLAAWLGCACLAGCGGSAPPPAGSPLYEAPGSSVESLERELAEHEAALERWSGAGLASTAPALEQAAPSEPGAVGGEDSDAGRGAEQGAPSAGTAAPMSPPAPEGKARESSCETGCRALQGMRRSAQKICELAGTTSEACARANERTARAARRVSGAGCECTEEHGGP
ncbi:MAG: hypothetical protein KIT72_19395 [Polyangiaceae bacterium]|nr:hypothetical protein [Polyangiaceae bacterium]MCW5792586.1 hypothetical protein [Polyangiaceae bacterium]